MGKARECRSVEERFWAEIDTNGPTMPGMESQCWVWFGAIVRGYGSFRLDIATSFYAHNLAWELTHGPVPEGKRVLHRCDNQACVRDSHHFLGS
jgi:hypothetical protein